jgi:hypothetical protein
VACSEIAATAMAASDPNIFNKHLLCVLFHARPNSKREAAARSISRSGSRGGGVGFARGHGLLLAYVAAEGGAADWAALNLAEAAAASAEMAARQQGDLGGGACRR